MIENELKNIVNESRIIKNADLSEYTSFKTGGKAKLFVEVTNKKEFIDTISYLIKSNIKFHIFGNFTNVLISDKGINDVIIKVSKDNKTIEIYDEYIKSESGVLLSKLAKKACEAELTGLEFASGIPGTLGGGICINAGAYDGRMQDVVYETTFIDKKGSIQTVKGKEHKFGYRQSIFNDSQNYIIESVLKLKRGSRDKIRAKMNVLNKKRKDKQPLDMPSAGSVFKRPTGYYAGKLIEDAGLKGFTIGGAEVSLKHAGFIINKGNATSQDIYKLIKYIQKRVFEDSNVNLETEIKIIGEFK